MSRLAQDPRLTIIGGGPAGLAPLLAAHRQGRLDDVLSAGVTIIEQSDQLGCGGIGDYAINSDSTGTTFAECLRSVRDTELTALHTHPLTVQVAAAEDGPVPLALVGRFMSLVGDVLGRMVAAHRKCTVLTGHRATAVRQTAEGWLTLAEDRDGRTVSMPSRYVVCATGAHQPRDRLAREFVGGASLAGCYGHKLLQSGDVFSLGGLEAVAEQLKQVDSPRVAIIGGSTSAAAVAHALLHRLPSVQFGDGAVTLLHRRPLHIYYPSAAEALSEGYQDFGEADICPISHRVFRLAGFRLDSRELVMQARGIGGRPPEPRLALHRLQRLDPQAMAVLDRANLVVAALGYRPRALPVFGLTGDAIELHASKGVQVPLVDGQCRILDTRGTPILGLFGIGLAAGFTPRGALGGEPSFSGQANGLWLWQNDVGLLIVDAVLDQPMPARVPHASPAPPAWMPPATSPSLAPARATGMRAP